LKEAGQAVDVQTPWWKLGIEEGEWRGVLGCERLAKLISRFISPSRGGLIR
jgi:hypothetical protein